MNHQIREIPGYYYDKEKNKYFKVLPHGAAPSNSPYSSGEVKKRKLREEKQDAKKYEKARQQVRIQQAKFLRDPLLGGVLSRELGSSQSNFDTSRIFAGGLIEQGSLTSIISPHLCQTALFAITPRQDLGHSLVDYRLAFDEGFLTQRINTDYFHRSTSNGSIEICHQKYENSVTPMERYNALTQRWQPHRPERHGQPTDITSMSVNTASLRCTSTNLSQSEAGGIRISSMSGIPLDDEPEPPSLLIGPRFHNANVSMYSSTAAPPPSHIMFAYGSSHGIMTIDKNYDIQTITVGRCADAHERGAEDVFALEFLSDNHPVLLSGGRPGILHISDLRVPTYETTVDTILHPSSISHIKQLDTHRILVAGLNSKMLQYDLRFRKTLSGGSNNRSSGSGKRKRKREAGVTNLRTTLPVLSYPEYYNQATVQAGLDIDVESGTIAAAQEDDTGNDCVQLFSLYGGEKLETRIGSRCNDLCLEERVVRCVQYVRDDRRKMKSLWFMSTKDPELHRFALDEEDYTCPNRDYK